MNRYFCEEHDPKGKVQASAGGSWCFFHKQELCKTITPHCKICGIYLCRCGGSYKLDDSIWESRKHCTKCGDYNDYGNEDMFAIFKGEKCQR